MPEVELATSTAMSGWPSSSWTACWPSRSRSASRSEDSVTVEGKNIGYELRCAPPIPFDIEYIRDLGYGAVDYLKRVLEDDEPGGMITLQEGHMCRPALRSRHRPRDGAGTDPAGERRVQFLPGGPRVHDPAERRGPRGSGATRPIAEASGLTPGAFRSRYGYLAERALSLMPSWTSSSPGGVAVRGPVRDLRTGRPIRGDGRTRRACRVLGRPGPAYASPLVYGADCAVLPERCLRWPVWRAGLARCSSTGMKMPRPGNCRRLARLPTWRWPSAGPERSVSTGATADQCGCAAP